MEQKDYILREIQKISVLLLGLLGKYKLVESKKLFEQEREEIDADLDESAGLNIDILIGSSDEELKKILIKEEGFNWDNIELLSDLLTTFSEFMEDEERTKSLKRAIFLLQWIDIESKSFSINRQMKISAIEDLIDGETT